MVMKNFITLITTLYVYTHIFYLDNKKKKEKKQQQQHLLSIILVVMICLCLNSMISYSYMHEKCVIIKILYTNFFLVEFNKSYVNTN